MVYIGLDIGSVSVNAVVLTHDRKIQQEHYRRTFGQPVETTLKVLSDITSKISCDNIKAIAVTGSGGMMISRLLGCFLVNEIIAQSKATSVLYPDIRSIIEIGGEDSKLILLHQDKASQGVQLRDFSMNTVCAAGTGSFLDQQAARLGINIEDEFGALALKSTHPPRIAGRCSVFAKSDMIHLQQAAVPSQDIIMGLCLAMARNFKSNVAKGVDLKKPVSFQGGVAANKGIVRAFESVFGLEEDELIIPGHFASMGAIGSVLTMIDKNACLEFSGLNNLEHYLQNSVSDTHHLAPLEDDKYPISVNALPVEVGKRTDAYLGIDVGSISTNLVVIDRNKGVIARRYLMTAGNPIDAVCRGLLEIGAETANSVVIKGVTTTGSGRYLIADFIGADFVKNEITAHARGAVSVDPRVDTVFEIGGQDSKYIRLENSAVVDFTMNKVCAAGTGSFLEEQAERLGISIKEEFGRLALCAQSPVNLGERCTVFMESSLNRFQQGGVRKEDLVAGLCYSIVKNYLNRVVEDRPIGNVIFFQGGTAYNRGVKAAFEKICGKKVIVPPHHDVLGALGSAIIALENNPDGPSGFKGFSLANQEYSVESFECRDCANRCEIRMISTGAEKPLYYGSRCGKYDDRKNKSSKKSVPDLFLERENILLNSPVSEVSDNAPTMGIPRVTLFFEMYPFWKAFFSELGFKVVTSGPTSKKTINRGCEAVVEEICFPIKVAHGHIMDLLDRGTDYLFLPNVVNMDHLSRNAEVSYNCLYVQSLPYLADTAINFSKFRTKVLSPVFHFEWGRKVYGPQLKKLAGDLGFRGSKVTRAIEQAFLAQGTFQKKLVERGRQVLMNLSGKKPAIVMVGRPYNGCDQGLNFRIPEKLAELGAVAIPLDFLPMEENSGTGMQAMYWRYGQRILSAARTVAKNPFLNAVYITNFGCGPDSFITKYFSREMKAKPFLTIEVDEHSADAGVVTRLEAFIDSLQKTGIAPPPEPEKPRKKSRSSRKVYIPYMDDHGTALAAAMRHNGTDAEALPMSDEKTIELGRRYTTGKECFPCILTTGDIIKKVMAADFNPDGSCFLMPSAMGPCRFGQYSRFHRMLLDDLGFKDVPIVVLDQTTSYQDSLSSLGNGFRRLGWQAIVLIDYIKKLVLHTRPYEITEGDTDQVYSRCLSRITGTIERHGSIEGCAQEAVEKITAISVNRKQKRPVVGLIGEIYVRSNQFSNGFIIKKIEALGGEVITPTFQEWIAYTDWERKKDLKRTGDYRCYLNELIKSRVQRWDVRKISSNFKSSLNSFFHELSTEEVMQLCARYV